MDEYYVGQFINSYFTEVETIDFFLFRERRQILIHFKDKEAWEDNVTKEKMQIMADLFFLDKDNLDMMVDRDKFETVMFFTATQGAMTALITEYSRVNKPEIDDELVKELETKNGSKSEDN